MRCRRLRGGGRQPWAALQQLHRPSAPQRASSYRAVTSSDDRRCPWRTVATAILAQEAVKPRYGGRYCSRMNRRAILVWRRRDCWKTKERRCKRWYRPQRPRRLAALASSSHRPADVELCSFLHRVCLPDPHMPGWARLCGQGALQRLPAGTGGRDFASFTSRLVSHCLRPKRPVRIMSTHNTLSHRLELDGRLINLFATHVSKTEATRSSDKQARVGCGPPCSSRWL